MILAGNNISYCREGKSIINNVNFQVESNQTLMITGKNGSGKTTLLRIITGILQASTGTVTLDKKNIHDDYTQYKKFIVYLGHKNALYDDLTVEQNLHFWAKLRNTTELLLATIHFFNLIDILHIKCVKLSAGWKKRVALSRLMLANADIWILDEPYVNIDKEFQKILHNLFITRMQQQGILILTSHNIITMENMHHLNLEQL